MMAPIIVMIMMVATMMMMFKIMATIVMMIMMMATMIMMTLMVATIIMMIMMMVTMVMMMATIIMMIMTVAVALFQSYCHRSPLLLERCRSYVHPVCYTAFYLVLKIKNLKIFFLKITQIPVRGGRRKVCPDEQ